MFGGMGAVYAVAFPPLGDGVVIAAGFKPFGDGWMGISRPVSRTSGTS